MAPAFASPPGDAELEESRVATYRGIVERGTAAFVARRFTEARLAFVQAFAIHPDPVLVFNIASCWRRDGDTAEALAEYRRFLTLAPVDDARRMLAEETIAALEAELAPPPAAAIESADLPRSTGSIWRPIGLATTGAGAVGLTIGLVELVRARSLASGSGDGSGHRDGPRDGQRDGDGEKDRGESARRRAILFGASGAAVMTAGLIMYVIGKRGERALRVTAAAGSDGGQVVLGGRF